MIFGFNELALGPLRRPVSPVLRSRIRIQRAGIRIGPQLGATEAFWRRVRDTSRRAP